jgi:hypothetical protein
MNAQVLSHEFFDVPTAASPHTHQSTKQAAMASVVNQRGEV